MSLETAIQENTKALQYLAEIVKQALSMKPVQAPVAAAGSGRLSPKLKQLRHRRPNQSPPLTNL